MSREHQLNPVESSEAVLSKQPLPNLLDQDAAELRAWFASQGEPAYRATQVIHWMHHESVLDISKMNNLSRRQRQLLQQHFCLRLPLRVSQAKLAKDGCIKWLLRLNDDNMVEMVYIPEVREINGRIKKRATLCISSQVGCSLNCTFCATGKQGFNRNLTLGEIIGQLWLARSQLATEFTTQPAITNVVFMGMGEPLLNYQPVVSAARLMLDDMAYGLSKHRVTISTSGVLPAMKRLAEDVDVALALSLHAPNDALRNQLVPINKKYNLSQLMDCTRAYFVSADEDTAATASSSSQPIKKRGAKASRRKVMMEYVLLDGVNDQIAHAKELIRLLEGVPCKVNLIPFNVFPGTDYQPSSPEVMDAFAQRLMAAGINTRLRRTRGFDQAAACGQLAGAVKDRTGRRAKALRATPELQGE